MLLAVHRPSPFPMPSMGKETLSRMDRRPVRLAKHLGKDKERWATDGLGGVFNGGDILDDVMM